MGRYTILKRNIKGRYKLCVPPPLTLNQKKFNPPWELIVILESVHRAKGFELQKPFKSYLKDAVKFHKEFGFQKGADLIVLAAEYCPFQFGFDYVRRFYAKIN